MDLFFLAETFTKRRDKLKNQCEEVPFLLFLDLFKNTEELFFRSNFDKDRVISLCVDLDLLFSQHFFTVIFYQVGEYCAYCIFEKAWKRWREILGQGEEYM